MNRKPQVSIITPFLNAERYLQEAISSVVCQTVPDWELILVDNGSTDNSREIAQVAASGDTRIKLVSPTGRLNCGVAAARNAGIEASDGDFLAFLDADDCLAPNMLHTVLEAMRAHPAAAMVFGPAKWWYPQGERRDWVESTIGIDSRLHVPPTLVRRLILLQDGHVPCTCSVLIRRSAVDLIGGFDERFQLYEDQALWVKLFLRFPVYVTPVCLSSYRQHARSVSAIASANGSYDRMGAHPARAPFLEWVEAYIRASGVRDRRLDHALRLARAPYLDNSRTGNKIDRISLRITLVKAKLRRRFLRRAQRLKAKLHEALIP